MNGKKGISPLIATVLIIGFTIVLAVLVITWISGTVDDTTTDTDCLAEANNKCLQIVGALTGTVSGSGPYTLTVANNVNEPTNVTVVWYNSAGASTPSTVESVIVAGYSSQSLVSDAAGPFAYARIFPIMTSDIGDGCEATCTPKEIQIN